MFRIYSWLLNNMGVRGANHPHSQKSTYNFWLPQNFPILVPQYSQGIGSWTSCPKSMDAQVSYINKMAQNNACNQPSTSVDSQPGGLTGYLLKKQHISGPTLCSLNPCCLKVNYIFKTISKWNDQESTYFSNGRYDYLQVKSLLTDIWLSVLPISNH